MYVFCIRVPLHIKWAIFVHWSIDDWNFFLAKIWPPNFFFWFAFAIVVIITNFNSILSPAMNKERKKRSTNYWLYLIIGVNLFWCWISTADHWSVSVLVFGDLNKRKNCFIQKCSVSPLISRKVMTSSNAKLIFFWDNVPFGAMKYDHENGRKPAISHLLKWHERIDDLLLLHSDLMRLPYATYLSKLCKDLVLI